MTQINIEVMDHILSLAKLAPSSHNTQPWTVAPIDNGFTIGYRESRHLKVGDPQKHELLLSLGCFIETMILSAQQLGYSSSYSFHSLDARRVATLQFKPAAPDHTDWIKSVQLRRSDRRLYEAKHIPESVLTKVRLLNRGSSRILLTTGRDDIEFLGALTYDATLITMLDINFRNELATWVRHNWTKKPDGMPAYTQGIPGPVSLLAKFMIRNNKRIAYEQANEDSKRVLHSAAVGLIHLKDDQPSTLIDGGRLYQLASLVACIEGVKSSGISAAVIEPKAAKKIAKRFKISTPVALIRFGYKAGLPRSTPRLEIEQIRATKDSLTF